MLMCIIQTGLLWKLPVLLLRIFFSTTSICINTIHFDLGGKGLKKKVNLLKDIMTKKVIMVPATLSIGEISKIIARDLSDSQMPAGIISASDIVKEIGKGSF